MRIRAIRFGLLASVLAVAFSVPAAADIVYDASIIHLGTGFGADPRLLTIEQNGSSPNPSGLESGCNSDSGGAVAIGVCSGVDAKIDPNGWIVPNSADIATGGPKDGLGNLASVGITNANQIILIYNPSQTGRQPATDIVDVTLKFYDASGNFITSVDGGCGGAAIASGPNAGLPSGCGLTLATATSDSLFFGTTNTNLGNGGTGFGLDLTSLEAAAVDLACGATTTTFGNCVSVALEATINFANDGPDSFFLTSQSRTLPEPVTLSLFGAGLLGAVGLRRRAKKA